MQSPTKERLDERLTFRLTPKEKAQVSTLADALGIKPSDFVRSSLQAQLQLVALMNKGAEQ